MKDYKVEMKPTWWVVSLEQGCYSDWEIKHLYFRGNDEDEVWNFLCRYLDDQLKEEVEYPWNLKMPAAIKDERGRKFVAKNYKGDVHWESSYGYCWKVETKRLHVITFEK